MTAQSVFLSIALNLLAPSQAKAPDADDAAAIGEDPWWLQADYAISTSQVPSVGLHHVGELAVLRRLSEWCLRARFSATFARVAKDTYTARHREIEIALGGGMVFDLEPIQLIFGVDAGVAEMHQSIRLGEGVLAVSNLSIQSFSFSSYVPRVGAFAGIHFPITDVVFTGLELMTRVGLAGNIEGKSTLGVEVRGAVFVGVSL